MDPIDSHYKKLKTEIEVLEKSTEEFKVIEEYVKNTHASTHTQYSLEIAEVFKVARKGEAKRFKPFRALPNRMLLWHGSRVTNFAGILSQGLRIAPPEVRYYLKFSTLWSIAAEYISISGTGHWIHVWKRNLLRRYGMYSTGLIPQKIGDIHSYKLQAYNY